MHPTLRPECRKQMDDISLVHSPAFSADGSWLCWSSSRGVQFSYSPREASAGCVPSGRMREITQQEVT